MQSAFSLSQEFSFLFVSNSAGILMKQAQRSMKQRVGQSHRIFRKFPFGTFVIIMIIMSLYLCAGQMHLWNPDEPSSPRGSNAPLSSCLEERLREACSKLMISWDGCAGHTDLLGLCEHMGLEVR